MNYYRNLFGIDVTLVFEEHQELIYLPISHQRLNPLFIEKMKKREDEEKYFLQTFYGEKNDQKYHQQEQMCGIREL